jgi:nanoRNase/pAp phosphatase (c-di-AMP/oligoRNAs hydrolase)
LRYFLVCEDELFFYFVPKQSLEVIFLCESETLQKRLIRWGVKCRHAQLRKGAIYRNLKLCPTDRVAVFIRNEKEKREILSAILENTSISGITVVQQKEKSPQPPPHPRLRYVPLSAVCQNGLIHEMEKTISMIQLRTLRSIFHEQEKVLLLLQYDPDPDAVASALAMRVLLGRNKVSAPIASFGAVNRPENLAMIRLLEIEVHQVVPGDLADFDRIVLLDVQPSHFREILPQVHVIIDHHPETERSDALFKDIRPHYGATSTILTEYLQADDAKITQRLATALLYGIKTDTLLLEREAVDSDLRAFAYLYPMANHRLIRQMERPQLPREDLNVLSKAFENPLIVDDVIFAHLGPLSREDIVPYIADFCLEVEGIEWAVASGTYDNKLIISARNYGNTRSAGEVLRAAFSGVGKAGGHRSMAKATVPLSALGDTSEKALREFIETRFLAHLRGGS